jgi:hypothetical protein
MKGILLIPALLLSFAANGDTEEQQREGWLPILESSDRAFPIGDKAPTAKPLGCCKVCSTGKPCGDTCISQDKVCHVGPGCAC